jgi:hypothetical protein
VLILGSCYSVEKKTIVESKMVYFDDSILQMGLPIEMVDTIYYIPHDLCCLEEWKIKFKEDSTNCNFILIRFDPTKVIPEHISEKGLFPAFDKSGNLSIIKDRTPDDFPKYEFASSDSGQNDNTQFVIANFKNLQFDTRWIIHLVTFDKRNARRYNIYFFYDQSEFGIKFKSKLPEIIAQIKIRD